MNFTSTGFLSSRFEKKKMSDRNRYYWDLIWRKMGASSHLSCHHVTTHDTHESSQVTSFISHQIDSRPLFPLFCRSNPKKKVFLSLRAIQFSTIVMCAHFSRTLNILSVTFCTTSALKRETFRQCIHFNIWILCWNDWLGQRGDSMNGTNVWMECMFPDKWGCLVCFLDTHVGWDVHTKVVSLSSHRHHHHECEHSTRETGWVGCNLISTRQPPAAVVFFKWLERQSTRLVSRSVSCSLQWALYRRAGSGSSLLSSTIRLHGFLFVSLQQCLNVKDLDSCALCDKTMRWEACCQLRVG